MAEGVLHVGVLVRGRDGRGAELGDTPPRGGEEVARQRLEDHVDAALVGGLEDVGQEGRVARVEDA